MSLEVIVGPMFSGKSEELIRRTRVAEIAGYNVEVFKPKLDTRSYSIIRSRSGFELEAKEVEEVPELEFKFGTVIAIDEAQFFDDILVRTIRGYMPFCRIIVSGLDLDFRRTSFGPMGDLLALADDVTKLNAVCHKCKSFNGRYTQRIVNGLPTYEGTTILVGDSETYEARCADCWMLV